MRRASGWNTERKTGIGRTSLLAVAALACGLGAWTCDGGPKLTENQKRGKQMYEGLCDKCHKLIEPTTLNDQAWVAASVKYGTQLKLTRDEIGLLQDYLTRANDTDIKD